MATENPLKKMKNAFYFTLNALLVLEIFQFLFSICGHAGKKLDKKVKINFKIYDVTNWVTSNYISPHISRSKGNLAMKFCQSIEYNLGNILLEN